MSQIMSPNSSQGLLTHSPELKTILDTDICPQTALFAEKIFDRSQQSVKFLGEALNNYVSDLPNSTALNTEVKTNRYAHALIRTYYTAQTLQNGISQYCDSKTTTLGNIFSGLLYIPSAVIDFLLGMIYDYETPISCSKPVNTQDQVEYTFCQGLSSFLAEKTIQDLTGSAAPRCVGISSISPQHLENFGNYWIAACDGKIDLSFSAKEAHETWDRQIKPVFCQQNSNSASCSETLEGTSFSSFSEWHNQYGFSIERLSECHEQEIVTSRESATLAEPINNEL